MKGAITPTGVKFGEYVHRTKSNQYMLWNPIRKGFPNSRLNVVSGVKCLSFFFLDKGVNYKGIKSEIFAIFQAFYSFGSPGKLQNRRHYQNGG